MFRVRSRPPLAENKMKKLIVTGLLSALLGGAAGYYVGVYHAMKTTVPTLDFLGHSHLIEFEKAALRAYLEEDSFTAAWALQHLVGIYEEHIGRDYESRWFDKHQLEFGLMMTHARLAKVLQQKDMERASAHLNIALRQANALFPFEEIDKIRLWELLDTAASSSPEKTSQQ